MKLVILLILTASVCVRSNPFDQLQRHALESYPKDTDLSKLLEDVRYHIKALEEANCQAPETFALPDRFVLDQSLLKNDWRIKEVKYQDLNNNRLLHHTTIDLVNVAPIHNYHDTMVIKVRSKMTAHKLYVSSLIRRTKEETFQDTNGKWLPPKFLQSSSPLVSYHDTKLRCHFDTEGPSEPSLRTTCPNGWECRKCSHEEFSRTAMRSALYYGHDLGRESAKFRLWTTYLPGALTDTTGDLDSPVYTFRFPLDAHVVNAHRKISLEFDFSLNTNFELSDPRSQMQVLDIYSE